MNYFNHSHHSSPRSKILILLFKLSGVSGSHVPGTKCAPAVEMINEKGRLKDPDELKSCK